MYLCRLHSLQIQIINLYLLVNEFVCKSNTNNSTLDNNGFQDQHRPQNTATEQSEYYDTPKHLTENVLSQYENYDTPPPIIERKQMCSSIQNNQYFAR